MISNIKIGDNDVGEHESYNSYDEYKNYTLELIQKIIHIDLSTGDGLQEIYYEIEKNFLDKRLLYSVISNEIYILEEWELNDLESACDKLLAYSNQINSPNKKEVMKIVVKLIDHINLALAQERYVRDYNTQEFQEKIDKVDLFMKNSDELNDKINNMNSQVISVLGIFTAISFILFGGISSAASILEKLNNPSLGQLLIFGGLWGLIMFNVVYFLLYYISKLTGANIKTNMRYGANIFRRHPYMCVINYILGVITISGTWVYLVEYTVGNDWIKMIVEKNQDFLTFGTFLIFLLLFLIGAWIIYKISDSSHDWG